MGALYRNIKPDIFEIQSELFRLDKKLQASLLQDAFSLGSSDEALAYNLGLWCKWVKKTDPQLGFILKDECNRLAKNFNETPVEDYFLLKKSFQFKFKFYYLIFLFGGLHLFYTGIDFELDGFQTYSRFSYLFPPIHNGLTYSFIGLVLTVVGFINLRNDFKRVKYYRLVK